MVPPELPLSSNPPRNSVLGRTPHVAPGGTGRSTGRSSYHVKESIYENKEQKDENYVLFGIGGGFVVDPGLVVGSRCY